MYLSAQGGTLEVIVGCMYSGKTEELRRRLRRAIFANKRIALFTSRLDDRHEDLLTVSLRDGRSLRATPVTHSEEIPGLIPSGTELVAIDEVQFFDPGITRVVARLAGEGVRVICAGLDTDFRGHTFGVVGDLLAQADHVDKLTAICVSCGNPATRTQRLVNGRPADTTAPTIEIGNTVTYEARCRACHMVPDSDE